MWRYYHHLHTCVFFLTNHSEAIGAASLDSIAIDESQKRELTRGDAVDKAEQLIS